MKIAIISDVWIPIVGGGQVHVENLCKSLIMNHDVEIDLFVRSLRWDDGKIYDQDEILLDWKLRVFRCGRPKEFFNFRERILSIFSIFLRIIKENKIQRYKLIHAQAFLWLLSGKLASIYLKIPILWTVHWANLLDKGEKSLFYYIEKWLLTDIHYDAEITVGSSFLRYPNVNKNVVVIPNWVNREEFEKVKTEKRRDVFKILFVGRLEWTKGIDILIEAIRKIDKNILDKKKVEFHIVWYGYQENEYKELIRKYDLWKYIHFRWKITWENLIKEYKESNLFILPSRTEGFGITIIEAMISRIPVIATRCGWPEDIIQNWFNWFLIEKENAWELSEKMAEFIEWRIENLEEIIENWYKTVVERYTWDRVSDLTFSEYVKIV